jgi:hypothetical protein
MGLQYNDCMRLYGMNPVGIQLYINMMWKEAPENAMYGNSMIYSCYRRECNAMIVWDESCGNSIIHKYAPGNAMYGNSMIYIDITGGNAMQ